MFAASYGVAFGALQQLPQIIPGLAEVKSEIQAEGMNPKQAKGYEQERAAAYTKSQEVGGLIGRGCLAVLAVMIISRRRLIRMFLIPGLFLLPFAFYSLYLGENRTLMTLGSVQITYLDGLIFLAGLFTVGQFSFWGNYLPRVFPVHLRGTGESFAANIGGRMIGTSMAFVTSTIASFEMVPGASPAQKFAIVAGGVALTMFIINLAASFFLPEPDSMNFDE
jgi:hypothetical protein